MNDLVMPLLAGASAALIGAGVWVGRNAPSGNQPGVERGSLASYRALSNMHAKKAIKRAGNRIPCVAEALASGEKNAKLASAEFAVVHLADMAKKPLYVQHEDSVLIFGSPRAGKTKDFAGPLTRNAIGPTVVTSTKADLVDATYEARAKMGRLWIMDPLGLVQGELAERFNVVKWSPVAGCEDPATALRRGAAWAAAQPMSNVKNGDWFNKRAADLISRYLHAAALSNADIMEVFSWTQDLTNPTPRETLRNFGPEGWHDVVEQLSRSRAGEAVDSLKMSVQSVMQPLSLPAVLDMLRPSEGDSFDPAEFVTSTDTLYLLIDSKMESLAAPIFTMLMDEVLHQAGLASQEAPQRFLWPPLRCVLDEVANIAPLPALPQHMADSGGRGIQLVAFLQSTAQLRDRWGENRADALRAAATVQLVLPGIKDEKLGREVSAAAGKRRVTRKSTNTNERGQVGVTQATELVDVVPFDKVRLIDDGTAWMITRNLPLALVDAPAVVSK